MCNRQNEFKEREREWKQVCDNKNKKSINETKTYREKFISMWIGEKEKKKINENFQYHHTHTQQQQQKVHKIAI